MADCVQCGYCCRQGICLVGEWDFDKEKCKFLTEENFCGKYDEIKDSPMNPAFGEGCSSSMFNTDRENIIKARENK